MNYGGDTMGLRSDLVSQLIKESSKDYETKRVDNSNYGTIVMKDNEQYVQLDGSSLLTPVVSTVTVEDGDRVVVTIKDHSAIVTGSTSSPSASNKDVVEMGENITKFETVVTDKIIANKAEIDDLKAHDVVIDGSLTANKAEIDKLKAHDVIIDGNLTANKAEIDELKTKKLDAEEANIKYAKIDFANIGQAAIEKLFADSGIIKDLIVSGGHVTGELVGVTIKGDLIEGNTIVADKLVVKGSDGLYYKLNLEGEKIETEQTEYNSLNGSIITAKSITATKIAVDDLVAFNATIAGINMTDGTLYSGVKASADNTTKGFYLDREGQVSIGDGTNFLKYIKNKEGLWKLSISAGSIVLSSSGTDLDTSMGESIKTFTNEFYASKSPTELIGGEWTKTTPVWTEGIYIWERKLIEHNNGTLEYTPSENGICITGNTGAQGPQGNQGNPGEDALNLVIISSNGNIFKNTMIATTLSAHVYKGGVEVTGSSLNSLGVIKWYKDKSSASMATGSTLTINPGDVTNNANYTAQLEG